VRPVLASLLLLARSIMKKLVVALVLAAFVPSIALAEQAAPPKADVEREARFVPAMRDGKPEGYKVYAIRAGGRFDKAGLKNGDTITHVNGTSATLAEAGPALAQMMDGSAEVKVTVTRKGTPGTQVTVPRK